MKVLICGEGPHDIGNPRLWDKVQKVFVATHGWMQPLLVNILTNPTFEVRFRRDLTGLPTGIKARPKLGGHGEKAKIARFVATTEQCDLVIFMADADSTDLQDRAKIVQEIQLGFDAYPNGPAGIACVPMATSESWIMADSAAWISVGLTNTGILPRHPELCWGARNDPAGNHPHRHFQRVCDAANISDSTETRRRVAEITSIDSLVQACPLSFLPFYTDLSANQIVAKP